MKNMVLLKNALTDVENQMRENNLESFKAFARYPLKNAKKAISFIRQETTACNKKIASAITLNN